MMEELLKFLCPVYPSQILTLLLVELGQSGEINKKIASFYLGLGGFYFHPYTVNTQYCQYDTNTNTKIATF